MGASDKEAASRSWHSRRPDHEGVLFMAETTIARQLHELEERYHHELMDDEERQLLLDRIKRLRKGHTSD
jgi:hypothetical protein